MKLTLLLALIVFSAYATSVRDDLQSLAELADSIQDQCGHMLAQLRKIKEPKDILAEDAAKLNIGGDAMKSLCNAVQKQETAIMAEIAADKEPLQSIADVVKLLNEVGDVADITKKLIDEGF